MNLLRYPNKILREKTKDINEFNHELISTVSDMFKILEIEGGVGLAAPQIGNLSSIFLVKIEDKPYVFINPKIIETEGEQYNYEGCLSIPGIREKIKRAKRVKVEAYNEYGKVFTVDTKTNELLAQVIQHEYDHLNGTLFIDRFDQIQKDRHKSTLKKLAKKTQEKERKQGKQKFKAK